MTLVFKNICHEFKKASNIKFHLTLDDVNNDISLLKADMSCLYYELVKHPAIRNNELTIKLPIMGQLFLGIEAIPEIKCVHYILNNYTGERKILGQLINNVWSIFDIPFPICMIEHEIIAVISFVINNPQSIDCVYGFLSHKLIVEMYSKLVYKFNVIKNEDENNEEILMVSNILMF